MRLSALLLISSTASASLVHLARPALASSSAIVTFAGAGTILAPSKMLNIPTDAEGELDSRDRELSIIAGLSLIGWGLSKMAALRSGATGAFFRMNVLPMAGATLLSFRDRFCAPRWAQALLTVTYSVVGFWAPLSRGATALASACRCIICSRDFSFAAVSSATPSRNDGHRHGPTNLVVLS